MIHEQICRLLAQIVQKKVLAPEERAAINAARMRIGELNALLMRTGYTEGERLENIRCLFVELENTKKTKDSNH